MIVLEQVQKPGTVNVVVNGRGIIASKLGVVNTIELKVCRNQFADLTGPMRRPIIRPSEFTDERRPIGKTVAAMGG